MRRFLGALGVLGFALVAGWTTMSSLAALIAGGQDRRAIWMALFSALAIWGAALAGHFSSRHRTRTASRHDRHQGSAGPAKPTAPREHVGVH